MQISVRKCHFPYSIRRKAKSSYIRFPFLRCLRCYKELETHVAEGDKSR